MPSGHQRPQRASMSSDNDAASSGRTGYRSDPLRVTGDTRPIHLRGWAARCIESPIHPAEGIEVYNFSTHKVNHTWLRDTAVYLSPGRYVIPLQVDRAWDYIHQILPRALQTADYLIHSQAERGYLKIPNFLRESDTDLDRSWTAEMSQKL